MSDTMDAKVSHRGHAGVVATPMGPHGWRRGRRDRPGDAALVVPGGLDAARRELRAVLRDRYEDGLDALDDPDLADQ